MLVVMVEQRERFLHAVMRAANVSYDVAEDIASEVTLKVLANGVRVPSGEDCFRYLRVAAMNIVRDKARKAGRDARCAARYVPLMNAEASSRWDPATIVAAREAYITAVADLAALPPHIRHVMYLRHYEGLKPRQVASLLNITCRQVEVRERQARVALQKARARRGEALSWLPALLLTLRTQRRAVTALAPPAALVAGAAVWTILTVITGPAPRLALADDGSRPPARRFEGSLRPPGAGGAADRPAATADPAPASTADAPWRGTIVSDPMPPPGSDWQATPEGPLIPFDPPVSPCPLPLNCAHNGDTITVTEDGPWFHQDVAPMCAVMPANAVVSCQDDSADDYRSDGPGPSPAPDGWRAP